ncbi:hypothetical protein JRI60_35590 [Archangium violaceum]|uniref:hypothetical protein n=1 Tax=Archangium violaceum TaxID=83451 RepID=UPI0019520843|nr:hypothetical protein [Archangium violaceum]QRN94427.1 hypothetical protein JRI60_35590 [Archangium violaceum]
MPKIPKGTRLKRFSHLSQEESRKNVEAVSARLLEEFSDVLCIRKTRRVEDEIKYNIHPRYKYYNLGVSPVEPAVDANYWHAAFTVLQGLPIQEYDSFKCPGVVISNQAELAGWGKTDLGLPTKNVAEARYPENFPPNAAPQANGKTLRTWPLVSAKLQEIRARVKGEKPDVSSKGKPRGVERMIHLEDESFPSGTVKAPYLNAASIPYGEAQLHYLPEHILGVYVELLSQQEITTYQNADQARTSEIAIADAVEAIRGALDLRFFLKVTCKIAVPFVEYSRGSIKLHASPKELMKEAGEKCPQSIISAVKDKLPVGVHGDEA